MVPPLCSLRGRAWRLWCCATGSRAEQHVLALEHLYRQEQGQSGVYACGGEDEADGVPMISARYDFLADQAGAEYRYQSQFGCQFHAREKRRHGGNDDEEGHGSEITLGFLVSFGEQGDGHQCRGKENGKRKSHGKNQQDRLGAQLQDERGGRFAPPG